jgi:hypothetical protein
MCCPLLLRWLACFAPLRCSLLQRNRNVQAVLESKQLVEAEKKKQDVKIALASTGRRPVERETLDTGLKSGKVKVKKTTKGSPSATGGTVDSESK